MRVVVDCEKCGAVGRREVTDLENGFEMLGRYRHGVGGVDQLRYEGTVGAKRNCEAPARAGRPVVADGLEQALVVSDRLAPDGVVHGVASRKSTPAIACLAAATDSGATESERRPARSNAPITRGSPPASPQRLTPRPDSRPYRATDAISRMTAGFSGSARSATAPISRPAAVTYWVRSLEPIEKKSASNWSTAIAAAGTSIMIPSFGRAAGTPSRARLAMASSSSLRAASSSAGTVPMGSMPRRSPCAAARARARSWVWNRAGWRNDNRIPRTPRNGLLSPLIVTPSIGLSPPASRVRMVTGRPRAQPRMRR